MGRLWKEYVQRITHPVEKGHEFLETGQVKTALILILLEGIAVSFYFLMSELHMQLAIQRSIPFFDEEMNEIADKSLQMNFFKEFGFQFLYVVICKLLIILLIFSIFKLNSIDFSWGKTLKCVSLGALVSIPLYVIAAPMGFLDLTLGTGLAKGAEMGGFFFVFAALLYQLEDRDKKARAFCECMVVYFIAAIYLMKLVQP